MRNKRRITTRATVVVVIVVTALGEEEIRLRKTEKEE